MPALAPPKTLSLMDLASVSQAPVLCIPTPSENVRRILQGPQDRQLASPVSPAELILGKADNAATAVKTVDYFIVDQYVFV